MAAATAAAAEAICVSPMKSVNHDSNTNNDLIKSSSFPPGFRFHPTDEELVVFYLKRKICRRRLGDIAMIGDVDVYKSQPWELPEKSVLRSRDKQWYFFSPRDKKYPNGSRSNRSTKYGYWKATGKDRTITHNSRTVGNKKTLVYYHGRAPKGERTDWVMHEYTLDDGELVNCSQYVQEYYALYKLFRKSGPGPKNGEEYGAPFREEDWEEGDAEEEQISQQQQIDSVSRDLPKTKQLEVDSVPRDFSQTKQLHVDPVSRDFPDYHLEQVMMQLASELDIVQPDNSQCGSFAPEVQAEGEIQSEIVGLSSCTDATSVQHTNVWWEQGCVETTFEIPSSSFPFPQSVGMTELTSLVGCSKQDQLKIEDDFLEIKDFNDPDSLDWNIEDNSNNDQIPELDEFYDPRDYFDTQMFLNEALGPAEGTAPDLLYVDVFNDANEVSHMTTELWTQQQDFNMSTSITGNHGATKSGVVNGSSNISNIGSGGTQEPNNLVASPSDYWFSSALTAFLDSVPSSPAMAAENPFISKALQRVSSFRSGAVASNAVTGNGSNKVREPGNNKNSLLVSCLVGLGAILWVFIIGISVKIIKGLWSRFS